MCPLERVNMFAFELTSSQYVVVIVVFVIFVGLVHWQLVGLVHCVHGPFVVRLC